jgi:hypothetical protein
MTEVQTAEASGFTALMLLGVILIPWLTLAISEVFLALYRRAVARAIRAQRAATVSSGPVVEPLPVMPIGRGLLHATDQDAVHAESGGELYARYRRATKATAAIYVTGGLAYAGLMAVVLGVQSGTLSFTSWWAFTVGFAWPAVLIGLVITAPRRRRQAAIIFGYFVVFLLGTAVPPARWFLFGIFLANIAATFVALVVRIRRIRAVAPLVGAVLTIVGAALLFAMALMVFLGKVSGPPGALRTLGTVFLYFGLVATLLAAGPMLAWLTLRMMAVQYGRKRTSEQAIALSAFWLTFAGIQSTTFAFVDARWIIAGLIVFGSFSVVTAVGFWLLRRRTVRDERGPQLLVLRVFALGRRSRRLFDRFSERWRRIGSVQLIAGPDLAASTVEPHEFLDFLRRRLGDRFLDSADSIDRALAQLDTDPDPDGQYRITDFICRDHAWRTVFGRLASASDVVLMDLRGFSPINSGCTYEAGELLNVVPFERITIIVDRFTDDAFLARTLEEAKARIAATSPNFSVPELRVRVFRETGKRSLDPDRLLRLLCDAVTSSGPLTQMAQ